MGKWCHVKCACGNRQPVDVYNDWGPYKCGHEEGALERMWPGGFFEIAEAIRETLEATQFGMFLKITDFSQYVDEYLALSAEERDLWRLETEMLQDYLSGKAYLPWNSLRRWHKHWEDLVNKYPNAWTVFGTVEENLRDAQSLCTASVKTGSPIEFWL
jgi:hypothetical protein